MSGSPKAAWSGTAWSYVGEAGTTIGVTYESLWMQHAPEVVVAFAAADAMTRYAVEMSTGRVEALLQQAQAHLADIRRIGENQDAQEWVSPWFAGERGSDGSADAERRDSARPAGKPTQPGDHSGRGPVRTDPHDGVGVADDADPLRRLRGVAERDRDDGIQPALHVAEEQRPGRNFGPMRRREPWQQWSRGQNHGGEQRQDGSKRGIEHRQGVLWQNAAKGVPGTAYEGWQAQRDADAQIAGLQGGPSQRGPRRGRE